MPIRMKVYRQGKETLVAAADEDLLGKTFREGKFKIGAMEVNLENLDSLERILRFAGSKAAPRG